jgi:hypothetical protein
MQSHCVRVSPVSDGGWLCEEAKAGFEAFGAKPGLFLRGSAHPKTTLTGDGRVASANKRETYNAFPNASRLSNWRRSSRRYAVDGSLPNDAQKHSNRCGRFADMRACNCSGHKADAGTRLAVTVFESAGRILPTLLLSLARLWIENRPNDREYQRTNSFCSRRLPNGRVCAGTRMAGAGSKTGRLRN